MKRTILFSVLTLLFAVGTSNMAMAQYAVDRYVFGAGGVETKNARNHIVGTLGQTLIGVVKNQNTTKHIGFWYGVQSVPVGITREPKLPEILQLGQNYPNPVDGSTTIPFSLVQGGPVRLTVVNILGETVRTLVSEEMPPGVYRATFDASVLPGGLYFYRLQNERHTITRTFVIRK